MHKVLISSLNSKGVSTDDIEYISFNFENSAHVDSMCAESNQINIDNHFSKWLFDNNIKYGIIQRDMLLEGVLYLGISRDKINLGLLDSFRYLLASDDFKFKFKFIPEAGSI
jgi:hypothetical protein